MLKDGDLIVLFLFLMMVLFWGIRWWKKNDVSPVIKVETKPLSGKIPTLLEADGYEVIAGKQRLPVGITVEEKEYDSRLYVDYIALRAGMTYLVVLGKAKKPLRLSGAVIRDRFLAHALAFRASGILYIDPNHQSYHTITLQVAGVRFTPVRRRLISYVVTLIIGAVIALLIR